MKIVTLTGHKHTNKDIVAMKLAKNSAVRFIRPYTDRKIPKYGIGEKFGDCHYVLSETLDKMMETEEVLTYKIVNGSRYVFFKFQLSDDYNVLIVDDYGVMDLRKNYKKQMYSIRLVSDNQEESDRVGEYLFQHEFDEVFDYEKDNFEELEWRIEIG